ncbi:MAG TPA: RNA polymerase sigma-70 factor [Candidatus Alistipes intestinipullorum]|nr:RNA polymerase sigma-70 factor [Candidatus Alistipes intestinipullorum]
MLNQNDFSHIYVTYYSRMHRFAQEYVLSTEDAENIVQDVFLDLWNNRQRIHSSTKLFAYLYVAIKNRCIDFLRHRDLSSRAEEHISQEYRQALRLNYEALTVLEDPPSPEELERLLSDALNTLPERCRQIFILSKIEGRKQYDIARMLHISVNTVESQMAIAYRKLRILLNDLSPLILLMLDIR